MLSHHRLPHNYVNVELTFTVKYLGVHGINISINTLGQWLHMTQWKQQTKQIIIKKTVRDCEASERISLNYYKCNSCTRKRIRYSNILKDRHLLWTVQQGEDSCTIEQVWGLDLMITLNYSAVNLHMTNDQSYYHRWKYYKACLKRSSLTQLLRFLANRSGCSYVGVASTWWLSIAIGQGVSMGAIWYGGVERVTTSWIQIRRACPASDSHTWENNEQLTSTTAAIIILYIFKLFILIIDGARNILLFTQYVLHSWVETWPFLTY